MEELQKLAVKIGADIPYCIVGGTYLAEGIGEVLTPLSALPEVPTVLIKPDFDVSTGYVYTHLNLNENTIHPDIDKQSEAIASGDLPGMAKLMGNVLETVTIERYPEIEEIKNDLRTFGSYGEMMSGSGPSVFGLFEDEGRAEEAGKRMAEKYPKAAVFVTSFYNPRNE
jgi:4-diphosphocytidyl-2-C-methyl-D-erythritol kinase